MQTLVNFKPLLFDILKATGIITGNNYSNLGKEELVKL